MRSLQYILYYTHGEEVHLTSLPYIHKVWMYNLGARNPRSINVRIYILEHLLLDPSSSMSCHSETSPVEGSAALFAQDNHKTDRQIAISSSSVADNVTPCVGQKLSAKRLAPDTSYDG